MSLYSTIATAQSQIVNNTSESDRFTPGLHRDGILEQIDNYIYEDHANSINQVTNISQLRDVSPTDWSYEALRSLVDRYGCIAGFPNQTYRGSQPLSRYEFAAGLNSCLNQIERLIAASEAVTSEDLATIQKLTQEFEAELTTLGGRIDNLEARTAFLEDHQFSTTTKLAGEVVFSIASIITGNNVNTGEELDTVPIFSDRARLALNTSFTGKDLLLTFLSTGNTPFFSDTTGTFEGQIGYSEDVDNSLQALALSYYFPLGDSTTVVVEGTGGFSYDFADTLNPLDALDDSGSGAISFFGTRNPIYNQVAGSGIGLRTELGKFLEFSAGYLTPNAADSSEGNGLLGDAYSALAQVVVKPGDNFRFGLTYVKTDNASDTFTGSNLANLQTFVADEFGETVSTSSNSYGVAASWNISDRLILSGWGGYINNQVVASLDTADGVISRGEQDIWTWGATLTLPDLLREGNLGGIVVGMEPKVTDSTVEIPSRENTDQDTSLHVEAFYQYQINDNIAVTPGAVWITAPNSNKNNDSIVIGTLRTTFTF
ncbi:MAG: iron uptake porin [Pleurocapsa sp.]